MSVASRVPIGPFRHVGLVARRRLRVGVRDVTSSWRVILQATVAATAAYALALAIGHQTPFFAPIAALATVAVSMAHRLRRSTELLLGNAVGIFFADLLIAEIGTGAWQLGLVVAIALASAILLGGGPILIMQSSSAAVLIATLTPPTQSQPWNTGRVVDALIGGGVGLFVAALLMPVNPARHARESTEPIVTTLATGYRRVAAAVVDRDPAAAERALADLRATASVLESLQSGLAVTRESVRLAPKYWGERAVLESYSLAGFHLDNALRNLRVLARQALAALEHGDPVPPAIPLALEDLALATDDIGAILADELDPEQARSCLVRAAAASHRARTATEVPGLFVAPILGQVRLSAADLLQATGMSPAEAKALLRAAPTSPPPAPHPGAAASGL